MIITHYGHACLLVELEATRILFDPGTLSAGFEGLRDLDGVFITHDHDDHLDTPRLNRLLEHNPGAILVSDSGSARQLPNAKVATPGETFTVGSVTVEALGGAHEYVYLDIPDTPNVAYLLNRGAFFHPGDSFFLPSGAIDVLALPTSGPWLRVSDAIRYVTAIVPRVAVPMHEAALANTSTHYGLIGEFTPEATQFTPLEHAVPTDV